MFKRLLFSQVLVLLLFGLVVPAIAQKRPAPRSKPAPKPAPAVTFENLLSADSYKIYVEVRNVGQFVSSSSVNEMIEPVIKLAGPPKEFRTAVKWLSAHADAVATSRMLLATWPTARNIPDVLVAVEFDTAENAAKFEPQLKEVLLKVLPPGKPEDAQSKPATSPEKPDASATPAPQSDGTGNAATKPTPTENVPNYYVSRSGSLVFITSSPLTLKNLRTPNSKLLVEDQNFRTAYDRFTSESVFAFINVKAIEQEENEKRQKSIEARKQAVSEAAAPEAQPNTSPEEPEPGEEATPSFVPNKSTHIGVTVETEPSPTPDVMAMATSQLTSTFFSALGGEPKWPEGIGLALTLDASSFDVRALLVSSQAEKPCAIPFLPLLASGPMLIPESPSILPADTELFVTMSLDIPQIFTAMAKPSTPEAQNVVAEHTEPSEPTSPFTFFENKLGIKFEKDLLPLLGNEVVFSMPVEELTLGPPNAAASASPERTSAGPQADPATKTSSPVIAISLRDKEAMHSLLPKLIDGLGFKGASTMATTERREDTEIVSYGNVLSYAFIGNFLVISPDVKNTRHVVDSYLKHETLSSDISFRNFTRWQSRQLQGQVYVSPSLMESYKKWANEPTSVMSEPMREFLTRLTVSAEPVTYSLSNEGNGPLHQLRIPKNLIVMAVAGISAGTNVTPEMMNERVTIGALYTIAYAETTAKSEKGSYLHLEELVTQKTISQEQLEGHGYKVYVNLVASGFEVVAVPLEYGKTGKLSYFVNESMVMRAGDHGGGPATVADKPLQ